jgi:hypothetical protein
LLLVANDNSASAALIGTGVQGPADLVPIPASLNFGDMSVNGTVSLRSLEIYNFGAAELTISAMTLSDSNHFSFNFGTGTGSCTIANAILPSGAHCTVEIALSCSEAGTFTASLDIASNDPEQPTTSIPLHGTVAQKAPLEVWGGGGGSGCFLNGLAADRLR